VIRTLAGQGGSARLLTRRRWLEIGCLSGLSGLTTGRLVQADVAPDKKDRPPGFGRAKSVILVYCNGGQSQLETWDPKPDAPLEIRGAFGSIPSAVPGTRVGEYLPRLSRLADRYTIVRSVSHDDLDHGSATYLALTGRYHPRKSSNPPPTPSDYPTYGSVLKRVRPSRTSPFNSVHINGLALVPEIVGPGQDAGFLGTAYDPLLIGDVTGNSAALLNLTMPPELPAVRIDSRRDLLESIDAYRRRQLDDPAMLEMEGLYHQAYELLGAPGCRAMFDLSAEPMPVRERYGLHRSGQACLLARRLAEAEVPWITVMWNHSARGQDKRPDDADAFGWDAHNGIFPAYRDYLLPRFDRTLSALLEDLEARGLMDQTLVVCLGEFGRAPRVAVEAKFDGSLAGRKHWANVYSILIAGAGIVPGAVFGASDRIAAYPASDRVGPWDIAATMFAALGLNPSADYTDSLGRPFPITVGKPIAGLYHG
jgi:hypothetical protein